MKYTVQAPVNFGIQIVVTIVICFLVQYFLPWWTMVFGAAAAGYIAKNNSYLAFLAGFIGAALLWFLAAYYTDVTTHSILTEKINRLLPVPALLMTTIIGGLVGGFAGMTGSLVEKVKG